VAGLDQWLSEHEEHAALWTVKRKRLHFAFYRNDQSPRIPLLCIEIIRDDRFSEVQKRCDGYIAQGVPQVWLLDAASKRAYTVTPTEGLREFKGAVLEISSPPLKMDLSRIFD
jgi:Uma2 family endonuclease